MMPPFLGFGGHGRVVPLDPPVVVPRRPTSADDRVFTQSEDEQTRAQYAFSSSEGEVGALAGPGKLRESSRRVGCFCYGLIQNDTVILIAWCLERDINLSTRIKQQNVSRSVRVISAPASRLLSCKSVVYFTFCRIPTNFVRLSFCKLGGE